MECVADCTTGHGRLLPKGHPPGRPITFLPWLYHVLHSHSPTRVSIDMTAHSQRFSLTRTQHGYSHRGGLLGVHNSIGPVKFLLCLGLEVDCAVRLHNFENESWIEYSLVRQDECRTWFDCHNGEGVHTFLRGGKSGCGVSVLIYSRAEIGASRSSAFSLVDTHFIFTERVDSFFCPYFSDFAR